ncbi:MAG: hypothetical protein GY820_09220, partial [Gammaproteobacteria bacterium]|nr:hypothetical protein [Gammaproteobacteria bacterium]
LGAVLCQKDQKGSLRPISFASSGLSRTQQSYGPSEVEALACVYAVRHFHTYIFSCAITIITDHSALKYLMKKIDPSAKFQRWILTLDQYNINWVYRKGVSNSVADALSRRYQSAEESAQAQSELIKLDVVMCYTQKGKWCKPWWNTWLMAVTTRAVNRDNWTTEQELACKNPRKPRKEKEWQSTRPLNTWRESDAVLIRESQMQDPDLKAIIDLLEKQPYLLGKKLL